MIYCDNDYNAYITDKYFDYLSALLPIQRDVESFRLKLEQIPLHIFDDDLILGVVWV